MSALLEGHTDRSENELLVIGLKHLWSLRRGSRARAQHGIDAVLVVHRLTLFCCAGTTPFKQKPSAMRTPVRIERLAAGRRIRWQNGYAERLIGSIRRECLDHVVVLGERHLRHQLLSYMKYHNEVRTHLSLEKDAPVSRAVERAGQILCRPILGGLHHQYVRI